jgi:hypothetical protein
MAVLTTKNLRNRLGIEDNQELPMFAWPGGYPVTYYVSDDTDRPERHDGTLCGKCVNDEDFGHIVFAFDIEEEDTDETCDHCGCFLDNPTRDPATEADRAKRWDREAAIEKLEEERRAVVKALQTL